MIAKISAADFVLDHFVVTSPVNQLKYIDQIYEQSGSTGLIFYTYIGCPYGGLHVELFRDYFQKKGISSANLEGSWQVGAPSGQLITRVRAFVEMLS